MLKSTPFERFPSAQNLHLDHAAVPQVSRDLLSDVAVSQVSVGRNGHGVAGGCRSSRCRVEIVRAGPDVDVVLRRERRPWRGTVG